MNSNFGIFMIIRYEFFIDLTELNLINYVYFYFYIGLIRIFFFFLFIF
jgi:hypothetical protein